MKKVYKNIGYVFLVSFNLINAAAEPENVASRLSGVVCSDAASLVSAYYGNPRGNYTYQQCVALKGHSGAITSVALSADNTTLLSGSTDNTVRVWSDLQGEPHSREIHRDARNIYAVAMQKDGTLLAAGGKEGLLYVFRNLGKKVFKVESAIISMVFNFRNTVVAVGTTNGVVNRFDVETSQKLAPIVHSAKYVNSIDYDGSGDLLVSGSADSTVRVWDTRALHSKPMQKLETHTGAINTVCFNNPRGEIVSGSDDERAVVWDKRTCLSRLCINNVNMFNRSMPVYRVAVSQDGEQVALTQKSSIALYSTQEGRRIDYLSNHTGCINAICYSSDGNYMVSGSGDQKMCLYSKQQ